MILANNNRNDINDKSYRKFGIRDKMGYMFGDFGNDFTFLLSTMFLLKFYTDVMGVSAGVVGVMMMVARFLDAFTDVTMGQIADRSKSTDKGKFLPWIRWMSGPVSIASFLMYATWFQDMPMSFKIFWMFFTYILWGSVFYTSINIPYGSMASAVSPEPSDRSELSKWRTIGSSLANLAIGVVLPLVVYYTDEDGNDVLSGTKMSLAAFFCSVAAILCYILCYRLSTERVKIGQTTESFRAFELLTEIVHNRSLIGIILSSIFMLLAQLTIGGMAAYIYPNYFGNTMAQSASNVIGVVVILVCATFIVQLTDKVGKKELGVFGGLLSAGVLIVAYFLHTKNAWVFIGLYAVVSIGIGFISLITYAMITDVIDDTEVRQGKRSDGTVYAVYSFARKMGQACSSGLSGGLLSLIGYTNKTAFDENVVNGIYTISCLAPAVGFILFSLSLAFVYPLGKAKVEENVRVLAQKHGK